VVAAFRDPARSRLSIALAAAFALHSAVALLGYRVARDMPPSALDVARIEDTEIEIFDAVGETRERTEDLEEQPSVALATAPLARARDPRDRPSVTDPAEPPPVAPPTQGGGGESGYAVDPSSGAAPATASAGTAIQLGIGAGDWSRWVDPSAPPPREGAERREVRPAPVSSTGGLAEALEARDQALGLGPAGAVLTAVHDVGYSDITPALGAATFSITVLRSGAIDVQLTGASSQMEAWSKVGESIAAAIRKKPPRIAPSRIGVRLGVEVVAEERWPNGQATRSSSGPKLAAVSPKVLATDMAKEALLDRNPAAVPGPDDAPGKPPLQANYEAPGVFIQGRGKICSYKIGLSPIPISGGCDPANIGQSARRVVSTRVVSQTML
jgi:hypothetical protein